MGQSHFSTPTVNMQVIVALFALLAVACARPDGPASSYGSAPSYPDEPASYSFNWAVKDDYTNNNYGQDESRNGYETSGSYYVALPDGRLQRVAYSVNGDGGYVADVTYEGEAQYPEEKAYSPPNTYKNTLWCCFCYTLQEETIT